jgi:hypothetical protein
MFLEFHKLNFPHELQLLLKNGVIVNDGKSNTSVIRIKVGRPASIDFGRSHFSDEKVV